MKTRLFLAASALLAIFLTNCGKEDNPSVPSTLAPRAQSGALTNECTNAYLGVLSITLNQWKSALDQEHGSAFLATPPSFSGDAGAFLTVLSPLLGGWRDSLNAWRGTDFLPAPPTYASNVNAYLTALPPVLATWKDSLETWRDGEFLDAPPAFTPDTTPPTIACLADTTVDCAGPDGMAVTFTVGASDSCDSAPVVECTPASGSVFPLGTTTVTCVATDADSNQAQCSFNVTVVQDTIPPVIVCPDDATVECTGNGQAPYTWTTTATDNCDASPVIVCDPPSGSSFPLGTNTVTCTATDAAGNSSQCTFTVTVVDTQPPVIESISVDTPTLWPPDHMMADVSVSVTANDVCDPDVHCWIDSITSNEDVNGIGDGNTATDWEITGPLTAQVRAERSGPGSGRVYTLLVKCADSSGNTAFDLVTVNVPHDHGDD
jgi:hypothetical protein